MQPSAITGSTFRSQTASLSSNFICRFARDLRLEDHAALAAASDRGAVVAALVLDDALDDSLRRSPKRAAFFCSAVAALDAAVRERGGALVARHGDAATALVRLARDCAAAGVAWSASYDAAGAKADVALRAALEEEGLQAVCVHDAPAVPPEETARGNGGYRAFQPYFERWREQPIGSYDRPLLTRFAAVRVETEALPIARDYDAQRDCEENASAARASALLERFLEGPALAYASARNVPAQDGTSRLAPHLGFGTIALRTIVRSVLQRLDNPFLLSEERISLRSFLRSLAMRDFFLQLAWFHPETEDTALQERMRDFEWAESHPALDAWEEGRTGYPLVDAGMRQLTQSGWMHPHVRAVTASFLCFDLGVDWRVGRDRWDRLLVEDDRAVATGNWQWIAGVGADLAQYPRIYNPARQQRRFDPESAYVRRYLEELRHVPSPADRARGMPMLPIFDGSAYPPPVVHHDSAARAFLSRYKAYAAERERERGRGPIRAQP
jgi:deoxyribodipyrimidine photo-lyase